MKRVLCGLMVGALLLSVADERCLANARVDGVEPGEWTMDLDAAVKLAGEKKLPLLVNFSGSDWCGWCKLMEKSVFSEQKWRDFAVSNVVMVLVDFPKDETLVPEKYVERNSKLKEKYGVGGFPTFIVLDDDGNAVLGRLSAGRDKTPESFASELQGLLRYREAEVEKYAKTLSADAAADYRAIASEMRECKHDVKATKEMIASAEKRIEELEGTLEGLENTAAEFRAVQLGEEKLREYKALKAKLAKARVALEEWLATKPDRSPENQEKFRALNAGIQEATADLAEF